MTITVNTINPAIEYRKESGELHTFIYLNGSTVNSGCFGPSPDPALTVLTFYWQPGSRVTVFVENDRLDEMIAQFAKLYPLPF